MTFFLLLLFGFAIGAKSAGLASSKSALIMAVVGIMGLLHFMMMRKKFA